MKKSQVVRALECLTGENKGRRWIKCRKMECPYAGTDCPTEAMKDALEILRPQRIRMLTAEEFDEEELCNE